MVGGGMTPQKRIELREELMELRDDAHADLSGKAYNDGGLQFLTDREIEIIINVVENVFG